MLGSVFARVVGVVDQAHAQRRRQHHRADQPGDPGDQRRDRHGPGRPQDAAAGAGRTLPLLGVLVDLPGARGHRGQRRDDLGVVDGGRHPAAARGARRRGATCGGGTGGGSSAARSAGPRAAGGNGCRGRRGRPVGRRRQRLAAAPDEGAPAAPLRPGGAAAGPPVRGSHRAPGRRAGEGAPSGRGAAWSGAAAARRRRSRKRTSRRRKSRASRAAAPKVMSSEIEPYAVLLTCIWTRSPRS